MKTFFRLLCITLLCTSCAGDPTDALLRLSIRQTLDLYRAVADQEGRLPRSIDADGHLITSGDAHWCSGFTAGTLWRLYEYAPSDSLRIAAETLTERVARQQYTTDNHDVGFIIHCSYGHAYRLSHQPPAYAQVIETAARSLATRFDASHGVIRSWNHPAWVFPVIIDNMMNLELLCTATRLSGDSTFLKIAVMHADTTLKYHFRPDGSSCHVVDYGNAHRQETHQGFSDTSAWARGQAWGLYGYTMMFRETQKPEYLAQAIKIAHFIIHHPRLPEDKIPYWDFDAPASPDGPPLRDASAAAIIASALLELATFTEGDLAEQYFDIARRQLITLSSPDYLAAPGTNGHFILRHSVGHFAHGSEVDVPLTYADYYFVEALLRYRNLKNETFRKLR
jgi:rhamnogalacturonyl hydrolase YesR